jgi:hypothetical protein
MGRIAIAVTTIACVAGMAAAAYARSPKDPVLHARPADVALAKGLLLGEPDLPAGFRDAGPDRSGSGGAVDCKGVAQPDLHRLVMTADVTSHVFQRVDGVTGFAQVTTEAALFVSAAQAAKSLAWIVTQPKAKLNACFLAAIRSGVPKTAKTAGFRLTILHRTITGVHVDVWEVRVQLKRGSVWIPFDVVIADYRRGRALENLRAVTTGQGLDPATTTALSRAVISRLAAAQV